jgi:uncharacterized iron-regulated membrane protein
MSTVRDRLEEIGLTEKLAQARRNTVVSLIACIFGIVGIVSGFLLWFVTSTKYELHDSTAQEVTYHLYAMEARLFWILGGFLTVLGLIMGFYSLRERRKILQQIEQKKADRFPH